VNKHSPFSLVGSKVKTEKKRDPITSNVLHAIKAGTMCHDFPLNTEFQPYNVSEIEITFK